MMSDLHLGISIALLPFWCLDAKGGEVVLLGFALGWLLFGYLPYLLRELFMAYSCGTLVLLL
jgi:hypothetical protein